MMTKAKVFLINAHKLFRDLEFFKNNMRVLVVDDVGVIVELPFDVLK